MYEYANVYFFVIIRKTIPKTKINTNKSGNCRGVYLFTPTPII